MLTTKHFESSGLEVGLTFSDVMTLQAVEEGCGLLNVADDINQNLTAAHRELKLLHDRLGNCDMQRTQELCVDRTEQGGARILTPKHKSVSSCTRPQYLACNLGKQHRASTCVHQQLPASTAGGIRADDVQPGSCVSIDQYCSSVRGRLPNTAGKESKDKCFSGGIMFYDHATRLIVVRHQVSLKVGETLKRKHQFEGYCRDRGVSVAHYYADNMPFRADALKEDCRVQKQQLTISGVGAHHQNGVFERVHYALL